MLSIAYLIFSALSFLAVVSMHVASYRQEISAERYYLALGSTLLLCLPLVLLFLRVKKESSPENVWPRFWNRVIEHCPRWIWGSMTIAWLLCALSVIRMLLGYEFTSSSFRTAWLLMLAGAPLSYAVTLVRSRPTTKRSAAP